MKLFDGVECVLYFRYTAAFVWDTLFDVDLGLLRYSEGEVESEEQGSAAAPKRQKPSKLAWRSKH